MKRVIVESPYAADHPAQVNYNIAFARACLADCLKRGEAPFASHLLYTQPGVLNDDDPEERNLGMTAGFIWGQFAQLVVVYTDLGITKGMHRGMEVAQSHQIPIQYRHLGWHPYEHFNRV